MEANAGLSALLDLGIRSISFPTEPTDPSDTTDNPVLLSPLARCEQFDEHAMFSRSIEDDLILYDVD